MTENFPWFPTMIEWRRFMNMVSVRFMKSFRKMLGRYQNTYDTSKRVKMSPLSSGTVNCTQNATVKAVDSMRSNEVVREALDSLLSSLKYKS